MLCSKCGSENTNDAKFCRNCGHLLSSPALPTVEMTSIFKKVWKFLKRALLVLLVLAIAGIAVGFGYDKYENRPQVTDQLGAVKLGMKPVEVTLAIGKPTSTSTDSKNQVRYIYTDYSNVVQYHVVFSADTNTVSIVCTDDYMYDVMGLGKFDSESDVLAKLGNPSSSSINEVGLMKFISYNQWKVAFGIQKGQVQTTCVTSSGEISFQKEHLENATTSENVAKEEPVVQDDDRTLKVKPIYYIGCDENYCSIPRAAGLPANTTCTWSYTGGNAAIPYNETTQTDHMIEWNSALYDLRVQCVDGSGQLYAGTPGLERPI